MNLLQKWAFRFSVVRSVKVHCLTYPDYCFNYLEIDFINHEKCKLTFLGMEIFCVGRRLLRLFSDCNLNLKHDTVTIVKSSQFISKWGACNSKIIIHRINLLLLVLHNQSLNVLCTFSQFIIYFELNWFRYDA